MSKRSRVPSIDLSRRSFLQATGVAGGAALLGLSACGDSDDGGDVDDERAEIIEIPDTGAELPDGDVTVRWLGTPDNMAGFIDKFAAKYNEAHPNITIEYDGLPNPKIAEVLPLGIESGSAHDIFSSPGLQAADLVDRGWVGPLDDVVPNLEELKAAYPPNTFIEGVNVFGGKTYRLPLQGNGLYTQLVLSNTRLLEQADVDPSVDLATFDSLREAARKITAAGNGEFYGIILTGVRLWGYANSWSHVAGAPHLRNGIDPLTGEYIYTTPAYREVVDFMLALQDDGSVFPGSIALTAQEATPRVVQDQVGIVIDGEWVVPQWQRDEPDFDFGVAEIPALSSETRLPMPTNPTGGLSYWMYAESPNKEVVGDILAYLASVEGQTAYGLLRGVSGAPAHPEALEALREALDDIGKAVLAGKESMVVEPSPLLRNPETVAVSAELKVPTPNPREVLEAIMVGDTAVDDIDGELQGLNDRFNKALDDAIAAAQAKGANVSRDDYVFPNYDPTRDYGEEDYAAL